MISRMILCFAVIACFAHAARGQETAPGNSASDTQAEFLQPGTWWNLYFDKDNDPLKHGDRSVKAVKIIQLSEKHPGWVQIAFPKTWDEHISIIGPAAAAHDDASVDIEPKLKTWEKSVTQWRVIWVNLEFVVYMSKVGQKDDQLPTVQAAE